MTGINLNDTNAAGDELLAQGLGEATNGGLGGAVDGSAGVGFAAGNGADVDDVAVATVRTGEEDGEDDLGHVDETGDVGLEHDVDVILVDFGGTSHAFDEAAVIVESCKCLTHFGWVWKCIFISGY